MALEWKNSDPRFVIEKRGSIVIIYPGVEGYLSTDWDESWWWIYAPRKLS